VNFRLFIRKSVAPWGWLAPVLLGLAILSGCGGDRYPEDLAYPPRTDPLVTKPPDNNPTGFENPGEIFQLLEDPNYIIFKAGNAKDIIFPGRDPRTGKERLNAQQRDKLEKTLSAVFGTPLSPKLNGISRADRISLKLDDDGPNSTLAEGSRLYRLHCLHCHGVPGDGRGPTAAWVNPHPRDFRQGIFKFTSISQRLSYTSRKARREDLLRTLRQGVEGTAMPSFGLLEESDLEKLVSYVIHLSLRGQSEFLAISEKMSVKEALATILPDWIEGNKPENVIKPQFRYPYYDGDKPVQPGLVDVDNEQLQKSIRRGYANFTNQQGANCKECHGDFGRQSKYMFDSWGTVVRPANLTRDIYRGGRRTIDLYWRINGGINGSQMTPTKVGDREEKEADLKKAEAKLKQAKSEKDKADARKEVEAAKQDLEEIKKQEQNIWDLVNFIQALPYPNMLPKDIKDKIYPVTKEEKKEK
jgi:mono/diheme cytochrome c family protein